MNVYTLVCRSVCTVVTFCGENFHHFHFPRKTFRLERLYISFWRYVEHRSTQQLFSIVSRDNRGAHYWFSPLPHTHHPTGTVFAQYILKPVKACLPGTHFLPQFIKQTKAIVSRALIMRNTVAERATQRKTETKAAPEETNDPLSYFSMAYIHFFHTPMRRIPSSIPDRGLLKAIQTNLAATRRGGPCMEL